MRHLEPTKEYYLLVKLDQMGNIEFANKIGEDAKNVVEEAIQSPDASFMVFLASPGAGEPRGIA